MTTLEKIPKFVFDAVSSFDKNFLVYRGKGITSRSLLDLRI